MAVDSRNSQTKCSESKNGINKGDQSLSSAIVFGAGQISQLVLPHIMEKFNVRMIIDNNMGLWGQTIQNVCIHNPLEVLAYSDPIFLLIASDKYQAATRQLQKIGVSIDRINIVQKSSLDEEYQIFSVEKGLWDREIHQIDDYDLLASSDTSYSLTVEKCISVVFFCSFFTPYAVSLIRNLKARYPEISFSMVTKEKKYKDLLKEELLHLYCYGAFVELRDILIQMPSVDICQLLWIEGDWVFFTDEIRRKCRYLNLCVGGSDLYRSSKEGLESRREIVACADHITAETDTTIDDFLVVFPETKSKISWLNFGIDELKFIDQSKSQSIDFLGLDTRRIIVTCGHNANNSHQHYKIINAIKKMDKAILDKAEFVFPMTYGDPVGKYTEQIKKELQESKLCHCILTEFLDTETMAQYALVSDIMIHVQTTDQLSSTMLQEMYAGAVVIAGNWLPYQMLRERGIFFVSVNSFDELGDILKRVIENLDEYKKNCIKNRALIEELSSWDYASKRWKELWDEELLG